MKPIESFEECNACLERLKYLISLPLGPSTFVEVSEINQAISVFSLAKIKEINEMFLKAVADGKIGLAK